MKRRTIDKIVSLLGLGLAAFLFITAALLNWGYSFADQNVTEQLSAQKIVFPEGDSLQLTTGEQAMAYAQHYIGAHVKNIAGGMTYSEISGAALGASAASKADPANSELATKAATLMGQRQTLFMGETLKGLLGNAYAFWQLGQIAMYASWASFAAGVVMLILSALGFAHLRRTPEGVTI
jgi:hypothetical protein